MPNDKLESKAGTWGAFKAAMEAQGVQDDDEIAYIDCREEPWVSRYETEQGRWRITVEGI